MSSIARQASGTSGRVVGPARRPRGLHSTVLLAFFLSVPPTSQADSTGGNSPATGPLLAQTQSLDQLFEPSSEGTAPASSTEQGTSADRLFEPSPTGDTPRPGSQVEDAPRTDGADSLFASEAQPQPEDAAGSDISLTGFVQHEFAYTYPSPDHFSKIKNTLEVNADGSFGEGVSWRLGGRLVYDPVYDATNFYPDRVRDDQTLEAQIREAFVDFSAGDFEFRLGRQHIIWGEVLGGFVADVVSAKDLREGVVQDFDLLRIPQWATMVEHYRGDLYAQLLWIPLMTVNDIGRDGSDFFPFAVNVPPGFTTVFRNDDRPSPALSNSGLGARVSYLLSGWDSSLFYFTSPDQNAAFRREVLSGPSPTLLYTPVHERIHQLGATVTKDVGPALVKLETVYTMDRLYETTTLADQDGLVRQDALDYLVGVEWAFADETTFSLQFTQRWFTDHDSTIIPDDLESGFSLYLGTKALHPDIKSEVLWLQSLNRSDWLVEAKVTWEFRENWRAVVGADIFGGPSTGLFGRFDDNDRVYYELRYTF